MNHIDRHELVKAELKCDQSASALESARVLANRCKTTMLTKSATLRRTEGNLARRARPNLAVQGQLKALPAKEIKNFRMDSGTTDRKLILDPPPIPGQERRSDDALLHLRWIKKGSCQKTRMNQRVPDIDPDWKDLTSAPLPKEVRETAVHVA